MKLKFLQEGGPMDAPQAAPEGAMPPQEGVPAEQPQGPEGGAPQQGVDPAMVEQLAGALIEKLGMETAVAVAELILQQAQGGGAPQEAPQEPMYARRGGSIVRIR